MAKGIPLCETGGPEMLPGPAPTLVLVPGLRGDVPDHWQTRLAADRPDALPLPALGRGNASLLTRVIQLDAAVAQIEGPVVLVAHSAGVLVTVHWAARQASRFGSSVARTHPVVGALLATPPALATPLPPEYPSLSTLRDNGWLPIPEERLWFPSILAASSNDPLSDPDRVRGLAEAWGSRLVVLGPVGHLNPASGYGDWAGVQTLLTNLAPRPRAPKPATEMEPQGQPR
jgi:uncharacterized protein